jgi:2OG-Fe(II) oxygenase superfamily
MTLQLTRTGIVPPTATEADGLRAEYEERSCMMLRGFLEPALLHRIQDRIASAHWQESLHDLDPPVTDLRLADAVLDGTLAALIHDAALFAIVQDLTGCAAIGTFAGRIYRMDPHAGHHDSWHGDDDEGSGPSNRMVALSVNLSPERYVGGLLELRRRGTTRLLHSVANTGAGDAILFRIDHALEHRVTDVEGTHPKIAWAGWFQREPVVDLGGLVRSSGAW